MTLNPRQMGQELKVSTPGFSSGLVSGNHSSQEVEDGQSALLFCRLLLRISLASRSVSTKREIPTIGT